MLHPPTLAMTTIVSQEHYIIRLIGTPVIPCGMVCSVEEMKNLVVTTLDCPGLTRTHSHLHVPLRIINVRSCLDEPTNNENIRIERLELYVK